MPTYRRKETEISSLWTFSTQKNNSTTHLDNSIWLFLSTSIKVMLKAVIKVTLMPNYLQFITEFFPVGSYIFSLFYFFLAQFAHLDLLFGGTSFIFYGFLRRYVYCYTVSYVTQSRYRGIEVSIASQQTAQNRMIRVVCILWCLWISGEITI